MGPTASGKTELAVALARVLPGEMINADSRQAIAELAFGVGKPTPTDLQGITCHGLSWAHLGQPFSVADYLALAHPSVESILARGGTPLLVGGTGLYVRALLAGYDFGGVAPGARARWSDLSGGPDRDSELAIAAARTLQQIDPQRAARLDLRNPRRVARAAELARAHAWAGQARPGWLVRKLGCRVGPAQLRQRIESRADRMVAEPFALEVAGLLSQGFEPDLLARCAIGYAEVVDWLAGRCPRQEAVERVASRTWRYARTQMTWLRSESGLVWVDAGACLQQLVSQCLALVQPSPVPRSE